MWWPSDEEFAYNLQEFYVPSPRHAKFISKQIEHACIFCLFVCLVGWLVSYRPHQQLGYLANGFQEIFTRCYTEIDRGYHDFCPNQPHYADTDPTSWISTSQSPDQKSPAIFTEPATEPPPPPPRRHTHTACKIQTFSWHRGKLPFEIPNFAKFCHKNLKILPQK